MDKSEAKPYPGGAFMLPVIPGATQMRGAVELGVSQFILLFYHQEDK